MVEKLIPRVESLKIGPSSDPQADYGPLVTKMHLNKVRDYVDLGVKEGAKLRVYGRGFKLQGYENGNFMGGCLFDDVKPNMRIYKEEIFGPVLSVVRAKDYDEAVRLPSEHEYGNGVAIFTRDGDTARDFVNKVQVGMVGVNFAIPVPLAYHTFGGWKRSGFGDLNQHGLRFDSLLHKNQNRDFTLAHRYEGRRGICDPDDEMSSIGEWLCVRTTPGILVVLTLTGCAGERVPLELAPTQKDLTIPGRWIFAERKRTSPADLNSAAPRAGALDPFRRMEAAPKNSTRVGAGRWTTVR